MIRKALIAGAAALAMVGVTTPAQANHGWVANSCVVQQSLIVLVRQDATGSFYEWIPCGTGLSGFVYVDIRRPTIVNPIGPRPPRCFERGQRYYPPVSGAVLSPTVRC